MGKVNNSTQKPEEIKPCQKKKGDCKHHPGPVNKISDRKVNPK